MYIHRGYVVVDRISVSKNAILENVFPNISPGPVDPQDPHHTNPSFHVVVRVLFPLTLRVIIYPLIYTHTDIHIHIHIHIYIYRYKYTQVHKYIYIYIYIHLDQYTRQQPSAW